MARIQLEKVTKKFGNVTALNGIDLDVKDKEFFILFGPAGAGKTTMLNNIAGIQIPEEGVVKIGGEVVNQIDPAHRNTAMVFENYALYPHMNVYDNIASPLRSPLYKKDEETIKKAVDRVAKMMKIDYLLERLPSQLSNGQKQRVALGRALVREPNVFLMDEPLAHLDAKLRNAMRTELKEIQANFETTSIYVTHDFMEAMSLGDRIAIVDHGEIVQIGTGDAIYYMPCNEFVAQLMGDPEINLIPGTLKKKENDYFFTLDEGVAEYQLPAEEELFKKLEDSESEKVDLGLRPQHVKYSFEPMEGFLKCTVYSYESIGNKSVIIAQYKNLQIRMIAPNGVTLKLDQDIYVNFLLEHSLFFHAETKEYISRYNEAGILALEKEQEE